MNNIQVINESNNELPKYETSGAAGFDLRANITDKNSTSPTGEELYVVIQPKESLLIDTGLKMAIPEGYELELRGRSGLAYKHQIQVHNGTIDCDYRGLVGVILFNFGNSPFVVHNGDRIAQGVIKKVENVEFTEVSTLDETIRGEKGFGHSGIK